MEKRSLGLGVFSSLSGNMTCPNMLKHNVQPQGWSLELQRKPSIMQYNFGVCWLQACCHIVEQCSATEMNINVSPLRVRGIPCSHLTPIWAARTLRLRHPCCFFADAVCTNDWFLPIMVPWVTSSLTNTGGSGLQTFDLLLHVVGFPLL